RLSFVPLCSIPFCACASLARIRKNDPRWITTFAQLSGSENAIMQTPAAFARGVWVVKTVPGKMHHVVLLQFCQQWNFLNLPAADEGNLDLWNAVEQCTEHLGFFVGFWQCFGWVNNEENFEGLLLLLCCCVLWNWCASNHLPSHW